MLVTNREWQLDSFRNLNHAQMDNWEAVIISFEAHPFLLHGLSLERDAKPISLLVESIQALLAELRSHVGQTNVAVDVLTPAGGAQPVHELWSYRGIDDDEVFYAYVNKDGELTPCHPEQPRCMTELQRQFTFRRQAMTDGEVNALGACAAALELPSNMAEAAYL